MPAAVLRVIAAADIDCGGSVSSKPHQRGAPVLSQFNGLLDNGVLDSRELAPRHPGGVGDAQCHDWRVHRACADARTAAPAGVHAASVRLRSRCRNQRDNNRSGQSPHSAPLRNVTVIRACDPNDFADDCCTGTQPAR